MVRTKYKIVNREVLLQNISDGLAYKGNRRIGDVEVVFLQGEQELLCTGVAEAINYLVNDTYWNEDSNWSEADKAEVRDL